MLKLKLPILWPPDYEKTLMLGKIESRRERGLTEDEEVGWHHQLNEHGVEQTQGDSEGQESDVLGSMGSQRVRHDLLTEQQQNGGFIEEE